ncbi:WD40 repeat domain-containing protein [Streptomyces sp. NPDC057694]|uniref:WD40 repeat domain-containing protein n=1 Tax=Streptomyces sp. NPDC057694 TaxID=3346216 RepID=UPI0036C5AF45
MSPAPALDEPPDLAAWPPREGVSAAHGPALLDWAADTSAGRPRVCLLRGARGSGKSHLLTWFLLGPTGHARTTPHATIPSAGLFTDAFAWELGRQLGYGPLAPDRLLERLTADPRPLLLLVPDLHLAGRGPADRPSAQPSVLVRDLLVPLLRLPQTRAVVEVGDTDLLDAWPGTESIDVGDTPHDGYVPPAGALCAEDLTALVPRSDDGRPRWDLAPEPAREHALDQALLSPDTAHTVRALLTDPGFLVHGSAVSVAACLADERILTPPGLREVWRAAAPQLSDTAHSTTQRAALLHTAALGASPTLARYLRPLADQHLFTAAWARPDAPVTALTQTPGDQGQLLAADPLGALTLLDPETGADTAAVDSPRSVRPDGVAVRRDGSLLLLTDTGALQPVTPESEGTAAVVLGHIASHHGHLTLRHPSLRPTALGQCPHSGTTVLGDEQGSVHLWTLDTYHPNPRSQTLHKAPITAVTCLTPPGDRHALVMSAALDGTVRLWATSADPLPDPVEQRPAFVTALASAHSAYGPILAVAWNDARLHLWHLATGRVRALPLLTRCRALALSPDLRLTIAGPDGSYALRLDAPRLWDEPVT